MARKPVRDAYPTPEGVRYRVLENLQHDGVLFLPGDPAPPDMSRAMLEALLELGVIGIAPDDPA